jgi:SAM-dependent methyltransferase
LPSAQFVHGDLEQLPFPTEHFGAALAANSVIFAEDIRQAMRELRRVVRPGGRVAITSWGKPEQVEMRAVFAAVANAMPQRPPGGGPFAWSADGALADLLAEAGLTMIAEGGSQCDFRYPDFGRGCGAAGPRPLKTPRFPRLRVKEGRSMPKAATC